MYTIGSESKLIFENLVKLVTYSEEFSLKEAVACVLTKIGQKNNYLLDT